METPEILTIRCFDACIFKLSFPDFLLKNPVSTGKKPLKAEKLLEAFNAEAIKQGREGCPNEL